MTSPHAVHDVEPGETGSFALPVGQEAALVQGGHLEPVEAKKGRKAPTKKEND